MFKTKQKIEQIKTQKSVQAQNLTDDYMVGCYNGMELALAILEEREPEFACIVKEPQTIETDEEEKRTIASGVIRRNKT